MKKIFTLFITVILMSGFIAKAETVTLTVKSYDTYQAVAESITSELTVSEDGVWTIADFLNSGTPLSFTLTPDKGGEWDNMTFTTNTTYKPDGYDYPYLYDFTNKKYPICKLTPIGGSSPSIEIEYTYFYDGGGSYVETDEDEKFKHYGVIGIGGYDGPGDDDWIEYYVEFYFNDGAPAAITNVKVDDNAPVEYFNLQGVRVDNPTNGLYIRRQGKTSTKVLVQ